LYVHQVISTLRGNDGDVDQTAKDFGLAPLTLTVIGSLRFSTVTWSGHAPKSVSS
jgi:hypothetical protein